MGKRKRSDKTPSRVRSFFCPGSVFSCLKSGKPSHSLNPRKDLGALFLFFSTF